MNTLERVESAFAGLKTTRAGSRDGILVLELAPSEVHEACRRLRDSADFEANTFITAIDRFPAAPRFEVYWQFLSLRHNDRVRLVARIGDRVHGVAHAGDREHMAGQVGDRVNPATHDGDRVHPATNVGDHAPLGARVGDRVNPAAQGGDRVNPATNVGDRAPLGARAGDRGDPVGQVGDRVRLAALPGGGSVSSSEASLAATLPPGSIVDPSPRPAPTSVPSIIDLFPGAAYCERECYDMFGIVFDGHAGLKRLLMPEEYGHFPLRKDFPHQGIEPDRLYREWDARRHHAPLEPAPERESVP